MKKPETLSQERELLPIPYQIICIFLSSLVIASAIHFQLNKFSVSGEMPLITSITPEDYRLFGSTASNVHVGMHVNQFEQFDPVNNRFIVDGIVWFSFLPGVLSLDSIKNFEILRGTLLYQSKPRVKLIKNNQSNIIVEYNVRIQFSSPLSYERFPLEDYRIFITLMLPTISINEIYFSSLKSDFLVKTDLAKAGWDILRRGVEYGYMTPELNEYKMQKARSFPVVTFFVDCAQRGVRNVLSILFPLILLFYISMFSFSISRSRDPLRLIVGSITALLAYRFVIETFSPKSGYMMLSDYMFILFLASNLGLFFLIAYHLQGEPLSVATQKKVTLLIYATVTAIATYLILN